MSKVSVIVAMASALVGWPLSVTAQEFLTITHPTVGQILVEGQVLGSAHLPVGKEYELLGTLNGLYLLKSETMTCLVDPKATNGDDLYLLKPLGLTHRTAPSSATSQLTQSTSTNSDVQIYPGGSSVPTSSNQVVTNSPPQEAPETDSTSVTITTGSYIYAPIYYPLYYGVPYYYPQPIINHPMRPNYTSYPSYPSYPSIRPVFPVGPTHR